ncbi:ribonuclease HI [Thiospirochaeta perfilievii]|uniref:Ribonuclease H n=1 Tax=Thiospirochaeta perfilievii TaxID=252967 RepID=A0A5C1QGM2_9SPIO|nr:ribonuclease HI [Thiospirochaeta perfilievii]QEN06229.1 ribonuclease HI [Thiospirochaeta perfilievii]
MNIIIYTDGGCTGNPGPGGWGSVLLVDGKEILLSGGDESTTNNKMELTAVIKALEYIGAEFGFKNNLSIYTDSQYVKNGITSWIINWEKNGWKTAAKKPVKNKELWIELRTLTKMTEIKWFWVKGHSGDKYNEICDSLVAEERAKFF